MKKRILFVSECSFKGTGYGTYTKEVLSRLHATGKYEVHELGCHGRLSHPEAAQTPWNMIQNEPSGLDPAENSKFNSSRFNQHGGWMFDEACIRVKPHIVIDIRDWYMFCFEEQSPARDYFHWAIMPAVDSAPQHQRYIETYISADAVFGYTDWAMDVMKREGGGQIKLVETASPGVDIKTFFPFDRRDTRNRLAIEDNAFVVGTVMRNQERKRYPELLRAFAQYLRQAPEELALRSYLYLHCAYPDGGWEIPRLIKEHGLGSRVLMTYICHHCGATYPSFFQDAIAHCHRCGQYEARNPIGNVSTDRSTLALLYNSFDVYVQYSDSEGFGMPLAEAAACGVTTMAVDYSAMSDVIRKIGGYPIKMAASRTSHGTGSEKAIADDDDFVAKLINIGMQPNTVRDHRAYAGRTGVLEHYDFDKTAKVWERHIDSVDIDKYEHMWHQPARFHEPNMNIPQGLDDMFFVQWCISNIAGRPELANSIYATGLARDLAIGSTHKSEGEGFGYDMSMFEDRHRRVPFDRNMIVKSALEMCHNRNNWEMARCR